MSFPFTALLLSQSSVGWQSGREDRVRGGRRCWGYFNVRTQQVRRGFVAIKETVKAKHGTVWMGRGKVTKICVSDGSMRISYRNSGKKNMEPVQTGDERWLLK